MRTAVVRGGGCLRLRREASPWWRTVATSSHDSPAVDVHWPLKCGSAHRGVKHDRRDRSVLYLIVHTGIAGSSPRVMRVHCWFGPSSPFPYQQATLPSRIEDPPRPRGRLSRGDGDASGRQGSSVANQCRIRLLGIVQSVAPCLALAVWPPLVREGGVHCGHGSPRTICRFGAVSIGRPRWSRTT